MPILYVLSYKILTQNKTHQKNAEHYENFEKLDRIFDKLVTIKYVINYINFNNKKKHSNYFKDINSKYSYIKAASSYLY